MPMFYTVIFAVFHCFLISCWGNWWQFRAKMSLPPMESMSHLVKNHRWHISWMLDSVADIINFHMTFLFSHISIACKPSCWPVNTSTAFWLAIHLVCIVNKDFGCLHFTPCLWWDKPLYLSQRVRHPINHFWMICHDIVCVMNFDSLNCHCFIVPIVTPFVSTLTLKIINTNQNLLVFWAANNHVTNLFTTIRITSNPFVAKICNLGMNFIWAKSLIKLFLTLKVYPVNLDTLWGTCIFELHSHLLIHWVFWDITGWYQDLWVVMVANRLHDKLTTFSITYNPFVTNICIDIKHIWPSSFKSLI